MPALHSTTACHLSAMTGAAHPLLCDSSGHTSPRVVMSSQMCRTAGDREGISLMLVVI